VYESYRCLYHITGGKFIVHSDYFYTVANCIDLFLKNWGWGIEALKMEIECRNASIAAILKESTVLGEWYQSTFS